MRRACGSHAAGLNRLGAFVATFMALYLTLDRGYSASYAGLVA
ncbi:MFS transporter, partial [Streptomyces sp. NPDC003343]